MSTEPHWEVWFEKVMKMFQEKLPEALLHALKAKNNPHLEPLCDRELQKLEKARLAMAEREQKKHDEYMDWIRRRDAGNERVKQWRLQRKEEELKLAKEAQQKAEESYVQNMLPVWQKTYEGLVQKRNADMNILKKFTID